MELRRGAQLLHDVESRSKIEVWIEQRLRIYFARNILEMSEDVLVHALAIVDRAQKLRKPIAQADAWIAATARFHDLTVVTRDAKDLVKSGVAVFDPWTGGRFNGA